MFKNAFAAFPQMVGFFFLYYEQHFRLHSILHVFHGTGFVTTLAGQINGEPNLADERELEVWEQAHRAPSAFGLDAVFSDISGITFGILNNESELMVYLACMESACIKSLNPRTGALTCINLPLFLFSCCLSLSLLLSFVLSFALNFSLTFWPPHVVKSDCIAQARSESCSTSPRDLSSDHPSI